jgi:cytochrome P450
MPTLTGFGTVPLRGPRALPFVGVHLQALRLVADPIGRMQALQRDFGDLVPVADRSPALVCAFGARYNHDVLSNGAVFDNDDDFLFETPEGSALAMLNKGLPFRQGDAHRRHRRLLQPAFQKSAIEGYAPDIVAESAAALRSWPVGQTADVSDLLRTLVQRVAVRCLFGLDPATGDRGLPRATLDVFDLLTSPLTAALPFRFPGSPMVALLAKSEVLVAALRELVREKRRSPDLGRDALALMLRARDEDGSALSDEELIGEVNTLFVAGHDTQAKTLGWTLFLLGQHPDILASLLDEIESVLRGGLPTLETIPRMPLLDRVLKESMRLLPSAPLLFIRSCRTEAKLGPVTLPRRANVVLSPFITQRDAAVFPEPSRFVPSRWETLQPTPYEYMPFGAGPRMCIGAAFANLTLRLVLPMILTRFRLTLSPGARVSRLVRGNILAPRHGLPMLVAPQDRRFAKSAIVRGDIPEIVTL